MTIAVVLRCHFVVVGPETRVENGLTRLTMRHWMGDGDVERRLDFERLEQLWHLEWVLRAWQETDL